MGISKKSINTGIMRIGLICSIIASIIIFFIAFMVFDNHNFRILFAVAIGFLSLLVVIFLFKIVSWIIAGFFD